MNELIINDYQQKYDGLRLEFLGSNMPLLFLKMEEMLNKPNKTKEDEGQYATLCYKIIEWNKKVKTVDMIYSSLPEYHPYIQNPTLFYLDIKSE